MGRAKKIGNGFEFKREILWILPGILLIFFTMYYSDIVVTSRYSFVFLESLFDNTFASFYTNAASIDLVPEGAVYDIGTYILFAIWAIPVWILRFFIELDYTNAFVLLYFKVLIAVFTSIFIKMVYHLGVKIGLTKRIAQYICLLTMSSLVLIFPVFVAVQYDIIPLVFSIAGLLRVLENDKKGFVLFFALAFTMKPFVIFTFVLILLIIEKRILHIFKNLILSVIPFGVSKLIYIFNEKNIASNNAFFEKNLDKVFGSSWTTGINSVSVFVLLLTLIYIGAYAGDRRISISDREELGKEIIFWGMALWSSFVIFFQIYPYWSIYLMPFLPLAVGLIIERTQLALTLDLVFNLFFSLLMIIKFYWVYCSDLTFTYLVLKEIAKKQGDRITTVWGALKHVGITELEPAVEGLVLGAVIAILWFVFIEVKRNRGMNKKGQEELLDKTRLKIMKGHLIIRGIILIMWFLVSFGVMFIDS